MDKNANTMFKSYRNMEVIKTEVPYFSHAFQLNGFQENIIMNMAKYIVLTYEMMYTSLEKKNTGTHLMRLKEELRNLSDNQYLAELKIKNQDSDDTLLTIYTIGRRGLGWLKAQDKNVRTMKHYMNLYVGEPEKIVKMLAANNLMIHGYSEQQFEMGKIFSGDRSNWEKTKKKGRVFRAYISFMNQDGGRTIIEPVRREGNGVKAVLEKLERMQKAAICPKTNLNANQKNEIILVMEDSGHAAEVISLLNGVSYRGFSIKIITDTDIMNDMVSFIQVTEKKKEPFWRMFFAA